MRAYGESIINPRLGQTLAGAGIAEAAPRIGAVNNTFNVINPDPIMMERATRRYLRRLDLR